MKKAVNPAKVRYINVSDIDPNPHNPRRLFDEGPMSELRDSIEKLNVLVPVTLYERSSHSENTNLKPYVLLDGERRWRCVIELKKEKIPAIVVQEPNDIENILTMFHIHNLREGWQLMPTALKLETLIKKLKTTNERQLSAITQLNLSQIRRCKILLSYSRKYQNMMLAPQDERLKADFFIELDRVRKTALEGDLDVWIRRGDEKCIDLMVKKYRDRKIIAVTDFRDLAAKYRAASEKGKAPIFSKMLDRFFEDSDMQIADINVPGVNYHKSVKELSRTSVRMLHQLETINDEILAANGELTSSLYKLAKAISERLRATLVVESRDELS